MKKRCTHKNMILAEQVVAYNEYEFMEGKHIYVNASDHSGTGVITVKCFDCDFDKEFGKRSTWPAWVKQRWDALNEDRDQNRKELGLDKKRKERYT